MKEETYLPLQNIKILQICAIALGCFVTGLPCTLAGPWLCKACVSWSSAAKTTCAVGA